MTDEGRGVVEGGSHEATVWNLVSGTCSCTCTCTQVGEEGREQKELMAAAGAAGAAGLRVCRICFWVTKRVI